jgi:hypothetical protein
MAAQTQTTRRALIGGAGLAGVALMAPAIAAAAVNSADKQIEQHWQERCRAYRAFETDPEVPDDDERAQGYWDRIDAAEIGILNSTSNTQRAAEIALWVAWSHAHPSTAGNPAAVDQGDFAALRAVFRRLDWHEKMMFRALAALRGEA